MATLRAVAAVRDGRPVEHGPSVGALKERCQRLTVEHDAVLVVLGERLGELEAALLHDQRRMLNMALDRFNAIDPEDGQPAPPPAPPARAPQGARGGWVSWT